MTKCLLLLWSVAAAGKPTISITDFHVSPKRVAVGDAFTVHVAAVGKGVAVGSYVIRTSQALAKGAVVPGLDAQRSGKAYLPGPVSQILHPDNGKTDLDPRPGAFAARVGTKGWADGVYFLTAFAHNRPAKGPHVLDWRNLSVVVNGGQVDIDDTLGKGHGAASLLGTLTVSSSVVDPGETVVLRCHFGSAHRLVRSCTLRPPYPIAQADALPGFRYDPARKTAFLPEGSGPDIHDNAALDRDPRVGAVALHLDTTGWPAGLHNFDLAFKVGGPYAGGLGAKRHFALKVRSPRDQLEVVVEPSRFYKKGTHFGKVTRLRSGRLVDGGSYSTDDGDTWQPYPKPVHWGCPTVLPGGRIVGMVYRTLPRKGHKGVFVGQLYESLDGGRTVAGPIESEVRVPRAVGAMGHAYHPGPLFMRSIVPRKDGSLLALMCGWFEGDNVPSPYGGGRCQSRSFVCVSKDVGRSWDYLTTVDYDPTLGNESYSEGVIRRLASGELLCMLRTGSESKTAHLDNPLVMTRSRDDGRTWDKPVRTGVEGVYPELIVMADGTLACSYGRPGAKIMFSTDQGHTWTDHANVDATPYSGYTGMCELAPGVILFGFGARGYYDEAEGRYRDCIRLTRIRVRRR